VKKAEPIYSKRMVAMLAKRVLGVLQRKGPHVATMWANCLITNRRLRQLVAAEIRIKLKQKKVGK